MRPDPAHGRHGLYPFHALLQEGLRGLKVSTVEAFDPANPLRVYLAFGANDITFGEDVTALWVGDVDAADGALWSPISGRSPALSLPPRLPITGIAIDPTPPGAIYVSHLLGIHVSTDGGASWTPFDEGLPNCFVADLDFHAPTRTLHVATMGRGLYRRPLPGRP